MNFLNTLESQGELSFFRSVFLLLLLLLHLIKNNHASEGVCKMHLWVTSSISSYSALRIIILLATCSLPLLIGLLLKMIYTTIP